MTEVRRYSLGRSKHTGTIERVMGGEIPVNPRVLARVQKRLALGSYSENRDELVRDIKVDPALYLRTAKELGKLAKATSSESTKVLLPERELKAATTAQLTQVFTQSISEAPARRMTPAQALRMQHSIISSRSAEEMAKRSDVNSEVAYSSALFRQLGLNMIAWNFPAEYARALNAQKNHDADLEKELEQQLGISPRELSERLAEDWGIDEQVCSTLTEREPYHAPVEGIPQLGLNEICDLAELFAKANDAEHYKDAPKAWAIEETRNEKVCGGISKAISQEVSSSLTEYNQAHSISLKPQLLDFPEADGMFPAEGARLLSANKFVRACQPEVQQLLRAVYERMSDEAHAAALALRQLVDTAVPSMGFVRGCLYILDEQERVVKPALRIGDLPKDRYQEFKPHRNNIITASLDSTVPILQRGLTVDGAQRLRVCGGLEARRHSGVLYLELDELYFDGSRHDPLVHFRAVRHALIDCLGSR